MIAILCGALMMIGLGMVLYSLPVIAINKIKWKFVSEAGEPQIEIEAAYEKADGYYVSYCWFPGVGKIRYFPVWLDNKFDSAETAKAAIEKLSTLGYLEYSIFFWIRFVDKSITPKARTHNMIAFISGFLLLIIGAGLAIFMPYTR